MIEKMIVKVVGNYSENEWQNPRTGEKKVIKSIQVVLKNGREGFVAEASDDLAKSIADMKLKVDTSLSIIKKRRKIMWYVTFSVYESLTLPLLLTNYAKTDFEQGAASNLDTEIRCQAIDVERDSPLPSAYLPTSCRDNKLRYQ